MPLRRGTMRRRFKASGSETAVRALTRIVVLSVVAVLSAVDVQAIPPRPNAYDALWSGQTWGRAFVLPRIARYGDQIYMRGAVLGGPAADPWWSCSQYSAWTANGTSSISLVVPDAWIMPYTGHDILGNKVNAWQKDGGEKPPYGWANRISDTCYCEITTFGATGGCESREVQPHLFFTMDQWHPGEGNVQFAKITSASEWYPIQVQFVGYAGVSWSDWAADYVYVVSDESQLAEDTDGDGLPDAWEYAHSLTQSLDDFTGGPIEQIPFAARGARTWVSPYAPREAGWVSAGPRDWDGDGASNTDEYLAWLAGSRDGAGLPFDPTVINVTPIDPFFCYVVKTSKGAAKFATVGGVTLADDLTSSTVDVKKLRELCAPADVDGGAAGDRATHLVAYDVKTAKGAAKHEPRTGLVVTDALGTLTVDTKNLETLLVRSAKDLTSPPAPPAAGLVDHFACYSVKITKGAAKLPKGLRVSVGDQFTAPTAVYDVKKLRRLCLPVSVNGAPTAQPATALACYQTKLAALKPKQPKHLKRLGVHLANDLGALTVDTQVDRELCLRADVPRTN